MMEWRKATASGDGGCVEIKQLAGAVLVRDSKNQDGPVLWFNEREWLAFLDGVKHGEFDLPT